MNAKQKMEVLHLATKYLGEGYYYRVYELDESRVLKKFQPYWFSVKKIFNYKRKNGASLWDAFFGAHRARKREERALLAIKDKLGVIPKELFANPDFVDNLDYVQDKVTVVERIFEEGDLRVCKKIIDQYAELQKVFWSYGIHDTTYKLQPNYGVDREGNLACLDIGELIYTKEEALKSIRGNRWLKRRSYLGWPESQIKTYYTATMLDLLREEQLNQYWNTTT